MLLKSLEFSVPSSRVLAEKSVNINQGISNIDMMKICRSWVWELDTDWTILPGNALCINHIPCTCAFFESVERGFKKMTAALWRYISIPKRCRFNACTGHLHRFPGMGGLDWIEGTEQECVEGIWGQFNLFRNHRAKDIYNLRSFWALRAGKDEGSNLPWCCRPA